MNNLAKIIGISTGSFAVVVLLIMFLVKPVLSQLDELHQKTENQSAQLNELDEQLKAYKQARTQLASVNYKEAINNAIVAREDLAVVLAEIESDAAKSGVTESIDIKEDLNVKGSAKPKPIVPGEKNIAEVGYSIKFTGNFGNVLKFMQYLENLSHYTEISELSWNAVASTTSSDISRHTEVISGDIDGVFFVKKR